MSESAGYVGIPNPTDIPQLCADCHSDAGYIGQYDPGLPVDQMAKYLSSMHGELLQEGDSKVAE
ncbi:MAG: hypothetical protein GWO08_17960, partial [Gammaproteobacteria bacterium]|nr:hypothetical protein [Gammaproteobacteria bacterium]NIR95457.1 hypothetical protein [Gammaproteobacteria bacterium]NIW42058.1 hypothetical protein [candidate division Zixibacteria bacterium]NIX55405.1 hypothetical protein [candidate division Zixibacteria bacterium]